MPEYLCTIKIPTILFGSCDTSAGIILLYRRSYPLLLSDQSFMASIFVSINHTAKWGMREHKKKYGPNSGSVMPNITQIQLHLYRSTDTNSRLEDVTSASYESMWPSVSKVGSRGYFSFTISTLRCEDNL